MNIILGGTGHVGSALTQALLDRNEPVTVVTRSPSARDGLEAKGVRVAVADVRDTRALRDVFQCGNRAFLLNPPGNPLADMVAEERQTVTSIVDAIRTAGLEKVVALSTYCARPGDAEGVLIFRNFAT